MSDVNPNNKSIGILNLLSKAFFIKGSKFSPIMDLKILEIINPPTIDTTNK